MHGNGQDNSYFIHQIDYFSNRYRVIALDTRGHGKSPRGTKPFTIEQFSYDLYDFMTSRKISNAVILGFSDGANIAMKFAMNYPDKVKALILNGGNLNPKGVKRTTQIPIELGYKIARRFALKSSGAKKSAEMLGLMVNEPNIELHSEIVLPPHAPKKFSQRSVLWNSVEEIEKSGNAQLAREVEVSLPRELDREQQIRLVRDYVEAGFVSAGMCADFSIHDRQDGNPHAHIMLTVRPLETSGEWGVKCRKEYILDKDGNRIKKADGKYKSRRADTTDWNDKGKAEEWRKLWADYVNRSLAERGIRAKVDHRFHKRQGIEKIPSVHMGAAASQMERRGISTIRGMDNRRIMEQNRLLEETGHKITGLCIYLKKLNEQKEDEERGPTLADLFDAAMNRALGDGKRSDATDFADGAAFLRANGIESMQKLQERVSEMWSQCRRVTEQIKQAEDRLHERQEMIRQAHAYRENRECYVQYKKTKPRRQAGFAEKHRTELALYSHAERYLLEHTIDRKVMPEAWKADVARLALEKDRLYTEMRGLRNEAKEAEAVMRNVKRVMQTEQPQHKQVKRRDIEL